MQAAVTMASRMTVVLLTCLVACPRHLYNGFRAGHPARRRCSSINYSRHSQSSRLAGRAPRSEIHCTTDEDRPLGPLPRHAAGVRTVDDGCAHLFLDAHQLVVLGDA